MKQYLFAAGTGILLLPLMVYGGLHFLRPPQTNQAQVLFRGISYQRQVRSQPRPMMIHILSIDLTLPGVKPLVTPGIPPGQGLETKARTTSGFLSEFKVQVAINASYFQHFVENTPWDYYPHSGDPSYPLGEVISDGYRYSKPEPGWRVLCFMKNRALMLDSDECPKGTIQGVAGSQILVEGGKPKAKNLEQQNDKPYPHVAVAIDQTGKKLWLIVVDGKQLLYSQGVTKKELANIAIALGADTALNFDGGGSTTLAVATNTGAKVLNAPIHTKIPMRERPVANHLGFYAESLYQNSQTKK